MSKDSALQFVVKLVQTNLQLYNLNKRIEGEIGLSLVQYHLLSTLRDMPGTSFKGLAKAIGMHPSSLTPSLKRLGSRELLYVSEDTRDSRRKMVTLTSTGKAMLDKFEENIERIFEKFMPQSSSRHEEFYENIFKGNFG